MRKILVRYTETISLTEEYDIDDEDFEALSNGDADLWDVTNIENDAWSYGDDVCSYLATDENNKVVYER